MRGVWVLSSLVSGGLLMGACAQSTGPETGYGYQDEDSGTVTTQSTPMQASSNMSVPAAPAGSMPGSDASSIAKRVTDAAAAANADASAQTSRPSTNTGDASSVATFEAGAGAAPDAMPMPSGDAVSPAGATPTIGGCQIFPADNPWNTRIDDPQMFPVHPQSATFIANMSPTTHLHPDWGDWSTNHYGIPWQTVPSTQAGVPMTFQDSSESDPGPYPFPPNARVEGGAGSGGDMHVLVLETGSCTLYETYSSTYTNPGWSCGSGAKFDLTSNALRPDGWTSADAAGLPILPGLVRVAEVQAGAINHALRFTVSGTQQGYIHPATHEAGSSNTSLPPMGLRVRLKASFDLSGFTGPASVILTAMKQYGLILADNGSNWYVTGDSDDAWSPLMNDIGQAFSQVHGSDFEAVDTGPIQ